MKQLCALLCLLLCVGNNVYSRTKTFIREYAYNASDDDSKNSARSKAIAMMRDGLLREMGQFMQVEQIVESRGGADEYAEKIESIAAGVTEIKILDERWDGRLFYCKAQITLDIESVEDSLQAVRNNKQQNREMNALRQQVAAAQATITQLQQELAKVKPRFNDTVVHFGRKNSWTFSDKFNANEYFSQGLNAHDNGLFELAIEYYQKAIAADPMLSEAYYNIGYAWFLLGNYSEAIKYYQKSADLNPKDVVAFTSMGLAYEKEGNHKQAMKCFQKAMIIDPDFADAYYYAGNSNIGRQDTACGNKYLRKAAKLYYNVGVTSYRQGKYNQAINYYRKVIAITPKDAVAYSNLGICYWQTGNTNQAISHIRMAARLGHQEAQKWLDNNWYDW